MTDPAENYIEETDLEAFEDDFGDSVTAALDAQAQADESDDSDDTEEKQSLEDILKSKNKDDLHPFIREMVKGIDEQRDSRKSLNDNIKARLSEGETHGLNREAVKHAMKYMDMDQKKKDSYMLTFKTVLEAHGQMTQGDLFGINT